MTKILCIPFSVLSLFVVVSLVLSNDEEYEEYVFKQQTYDIIETMMDEEPYDNENYLVTLSPQAKDRLCEEAKKFAALDGLDSCTGEIHHLNRYTLTNNSSTPPTVTDVGLRCETIPLSYLFMGKPGEPRQKNRMVTKGDSGSNSSEMMVTSASTAGLSLGKRVIITKTIKEITIVVRKNKYMSEPYILSTTPIDAPPEPCPIDDKSSEQAKLYRMYSHDRLDVCVAAKKQVKEVVPKLTKVIIEEQKTYYFQIENSKVKLMAINCLSIPEMYVHFKEPTANTSGTGVERPIEVIWVRQNVNETATEVTGGTAERASDEGNSRMITDEILERTPIRRRTRTTRALESIQE